MGELLDDENDLLRANQQSADSDVPKSYGIWLAVLDLFPFYWLDA